MNQSPTPQFIDEQMPDSSNAALARRRKQFALDGAYLAPADRAAQIKPGDKVRHALRTSDHDDWIGIVVQVDTEEGVDFRRVSYRVRWISPTGAPNDGTTAHPGCELRQHQERQP
jgi:hypothetical protein